MTLFRRKNTLQNAGKYGDAMKVAAATPLAKMPETPLQQAKIVYEKMLAREGAEETGKKLGKSLTWHQFDRQITPGMMSLMLLAASNLRLEGTLEKLGAIAALAGSVAIDIILARRRERKLTVQQESMKQMGINKFERLCAAAMNSMNETAGRIKAEIFNFAAAGSLLAASILNKDQGQKWIAAVLIAWTAVQYHFSKSDTKKNAKFAEHIMANRNELEKNARAGIPDSDL